MRRMSLAATLHIPHCELPPECVSLREEVRAFLRETLPLHRQAEPETFSACDPAFSRKLGARGWIGMTWPRAYGGHERSLLERYVVLEELIASEAPVMAHWIADRQTGPQILRYGTEPLKQALLPAIARGELYCCIGMSEPDAGSDLAAIRTRGERVPGGWKLQGRKIWNSAAHAHIMLTLARTAPVNAEDRHAGLTQFLIDLKSPGVSVRRIRNLTGAEGFCEVLLEDVFVPDDRLLGQEGQGWRQVTAELGDERAGPERYTSSLPLLRHMLDAADPADARAAVEIGKLVAQARTLRRMSVGLAGMAARGGDLVTGGALYKDLGTTFEQRVPEVAQDLFDEASIEPGSGFEQTLRRIVQVSPTYSLRGGSREVLRGVIARRLGLR